MTTKKKTTNEYIVTVEGAGDIHISEDGTTDHSERQGKFQSGLLRDGITNGTDWYPPHRILRVQRRDVA